MWAYIRKNPNFLVANNVAQGINGAAFIFPGTDCEKETGFLHNSAGSSIVGWLVSVNSTSCLNLSHFTAYRSQNGVMEYLSVDRVRASYLILAENKEGFAIMNGHEAEDNKLGDKLNEKN